MRKRKAWPKVPAADWLHRRRRSAEWAIERRSLELELDCLGELLDAGLVDPFTGASVGARGALALGADCLLVLPWIGRVDALAGCN